MQGTSWVLPAILLEIKEQGRSVRFWFSGDIGRFKLPLLQGSGAAGAGGLSADGMHLRRSGAQ